MPSIQDKNKDKPGLAQTVRRVASLTAPYFRSEEKWKARGMLLAIVALNLGAV